MAKSDYLNLLLQDQDILYTPKETAYGAAATGIASALPGVVDPYGSTSGNIARVLGGALLSGLLGYQAKKQAEEENKALLPELTALMGAGSQEEIGALLEQSKYADRLSPLAMSLYGQLGTAEQKAKELESERAFQREMQQSKNLAKIEAAGIAAQARATGQAEKERLRREAFTPKQEEIISDGMYAISKIQELNNRIKKISTTDLKIMQTTGLSPSSDPGLASAIELTLGDERIKRYGASLTGNELKAFKTASGQNLLAGKESTMEAMNNLRNSLIGRAKQLATAKKLTPESLGTWIEQQEGGTSPKQIFENYMTNLKQKYPDITQATPAEKEEAKRLGELAKE